MIAVNARAFTTAIGQGEAGGAIWEAGLPALSLAVLAGLTLAGVRPRLAEYR